MHTCGSQESIGKDIAVSYLKEDARVGNSRSSAVKRVSFSFSTGANEISAWTRTIQPISSERGAAGSTVQLFGSTSGHAMRR